MGSYPRRGDVGSLLFVCEAFPPQGVVGAFRVAKTVKLLLAQGYRVAVVTLAHHPSCPYDDTLLADVAGCKLHGVDYVTSALLPRHLRLMRSFARAITAAVAAERPAFIYYSGGPFYYFALAPVLKRRLGLPYVLDFRDPWLLREGVRTTAKIYARGFEPRAVRHAERIINVTRHATELYRTRYADVDPRRFVTVENGFDPDDLPHPPSPRASRGGGLRIVYAGKFAGREPAPFLEALRALVDHPAAAGSRFVHIGPFDPRMGRLCRALDLERYVCFRGYLPLREALREIQASDIGLLVTGMYRWEPTTKLYDYLATRTPILAIAHPSGYVHDVLQDTQSGILVENDRAAILDAMLTLTRERPQFQFRNLHKHTRQAQAQVLIDEVVAPLAGAPPRAR